MIYTYIWTICHSPLFKTNPPKIPPAWPRSRGLLLLPWIFLLRIPRTAQAKPDATARRVKQVTLPPLKGTMPAVSPARQRIWMHGWSVGDIYFTHTYDIKGDLFYTKRWNKLKCDSPDVSETIFFGPPNGSIKTTREFRHSSAKYRG